MKVPDNILYTPCCNAPLVYYDDPPDDGGKYAACPDCDQTWNIGAEFVDNNPPQKTEWLKSQPRRRDWKKG